MFHSGNYEPMGRRKPPTKKQLEDAVADARGKMVGKLLLAREAHDAQEKAQAELRDAVDAYKAAMLALEGAL